VQLFIPARNKKEAERGAPFWARGRHHGADRQPQLSGDRDHSVSCQWRYAGATVSGTTVSINGKREVRFASGSEGPPVILLRDNLIEAMLRDSVGWAIGQTYPAALSQHVRQHWAKVFLAICRRAGRM
jgi:hypothetical protein